MEDIYLYTDATLLTQMKSSKYELGFFRVKFYTKDGKLENSVTEEISDFYFYPSGGTLRDKNFNIVHYNARFDTYRGFDPKNLFATK